MQIVVRRLLVFLILAVPLMWGQRPAVRSRTLGPITLSVDATEAPRHILHARLTVPATGGAMTFYYPKWIPGEHAPTGPILELAGLKFSAGGTAAPWTRDLLDMYTFHVQVPRGATALEIALDYLVPNVTEGFSSGASTTEKAGVISWNQVLLYPAGYHAAELTYTASLRLPEGWKFGSALPLAGTSGSTVQFEPVPLSTLVDSPVLIGANLRTIELSPGETPPHFLHMAADDAADLAMPPEQVNAYKQLVAETGALFGARHYRDYHFLYTLSDYSTHFGLEHHESSDDRVGERTVVDHDAFLLEAGLLPHEMVHSWNGKYRRPADLTTPDYETPMRTDLLWVYEGLTQYLGTILTPRSGLYTPEEFRDHLAETAARLDHLPGRSWRDLQDTANAAQVLYFAPEAWQSWRREVDFYDESTLIWLDVDTTIRRLTGDKKSMDDFCHIFHGPPGTGPMVKTYTFEDVVATLNQVAPYDWAKFLRTRLESHGPGAPLDGITNGGWKLEYTDVVPPLQRSAEESEKFTDVRYSLGFSVDEHGHIPDVIVDSPAAKAGLAPDMKLVAINGRKFERDSDNLRGAIRAAKGTSEPIELLVESNGFYRTLKVDYHDGEKYPHLVRDESRPDYLDEIIKPHAAKVGGQ